MKKLLSTLTAAAIITSALPVITSAKSFSDVSGSEYYADAAGNLSDAGILDGYDDGSFGASKSITRAEMAAVICRMLGKEDEAKEDNAVSEFTDVGSHWAKGYINTAAKADIVNGDDEGTFRPDDTVKYEEAIKMVVCAAGLAENITIDPSDWSAAYITAADENGITLNLTGAKGNPSTRGDVAVMVYNAMAEDKEPETPTEVPTEVPTAEPTEIPEYAAATPIPDSGWEGKNILFIGDQLTSDKVYPQFIEKLLGCNVSYHCDNDATILQLVDGMNGLYGNYSGDTLAPLSTADVRDMDLIVVHAGYNDRNVKAGDAGFCYDEQDDSSKTVAGYLQYAINRINETLAKAGNTKCRLLIVTPDNCGRSPYCNVTATASYPGTSQTLEAIVEAEKSVARLNKIPYCDIYHGTDINKNTWKLYSKDANANNSEYQVYAVNGSGVRESNTALKYINGKSYVQKRNGEYVSEIYTGTAPYPYYGDQIHKNEAGYYVIARAITDTILKEF